MSEVPATAVPTTGPQATARREWVPVDELFARRAAQAPQAVALEGRGLAVSYAELAAATEDVAGRLLGAGVRRGDIVAVSVTRSAEWVVALLACLRARALFLPLDPQTPPARRAAILAEAEPAAVLAGGGEETVLAAALAEVGGTATLVALGEARRGLALPSIAGRDAAPVGEPDDPCYIYYTSGSTGRPKGIVGRLKSIDHFIRWEIDALGLEAGPRVSQLMVPTFDAFLRDVFVPLVSGGTLCLPRRGRQPLAGRELGEWLAAARVEVVHTVPSVFRTLLASPPPGGLPALRWVLLSGEPLLPSDVARWTEVVGAEGARLVNLYGPTETTMTKLAYFVRPEDAERRSIPIGQPIRGARALVVDARGEPCATGVPGEIYLRTPFRSLGYFRQPETTAEVFVPNPFSDDPHDLVYKTGDLGRMLDDGNLEFLGRKDRQVKVRGIRVELDEVEKAVLAFPGVAEAAVVPRQDAAGSSYLCAYVVPEGGGGGDGGLETEALRASLAERLSEGALPSAYLVLDVLPRTRSGKIDRTSLPDPNEVRARRARDEAARTPVEEAIATTWEELLGLERVGLYESFFELGGHSLLALQVVGRLREALGVELELPEVFDAPTVARLATRIEERRRDAGGGPRPGRPALAPSAEAGPAPLSFAQQRLWFLDQVEPGSPAYNMPLTVELAGGLDRGALAAALTAVRARHEPLRTRLVATAGEPWQVVDPPLPLALPLVDLAALPAGRRAGEARRLRAADARRPFDLHAGPVLRAFVVRLSGELAHLAVTLHHVAADGWSIGVLVREVVEHYRAAVGGVAAQVPRLPLTYRDWSRWQRVALAGEALEEELAFWRGELAGAPAMIELPADRPRPAERSDAGGEVEVRLAAGLVADLGALAGGRGATLFMALLAGFFAWLARVTGQRDLPVGVPVAGRVHPTLEPLIGLFVNTLVVRARLAPGAPFAALLDEVRSRVLAAQAHQEMPFERLVDELVPQRGASHSPLVQVVFSLQNVPQGVLVAPGLSLRPLGSATRTAKFDLTVVLQDSAEGGLIGRVEFSRDLFDEETVRQMVGQLARVLAGAAAAPGSPWDALPLLSDDERRQVLETWSGASAPYPADRSLGDLFVERAGRRPELPAVEFPDGGLTYGELDAASAGLAARLAAAGVTVETPVALLVERSADLVVAMLAVVRAGGAYVPLDPGYPEERLAFMLGDTGAAIAVVGPGLEARLPPGTPCVTLGDAAEEPAPTVLPAVGGGQLAYVMYTSGSTGRAKGVAVPHRAIARLVLGTDYLQVREGERVAQAASSSFDAVTFEVWGPLLNGGCVVGIDREALLTPGGLRHALTSRSVDHLFLTTALFHHLAQAEPDVFAGLDTVMFGGEAVDPRRVRQVLAAGGPRRLLHVYGPTESTTFASWHPVAEVADDAATVPIGRALANGRLYVLDRAGRAVPPGVAGELFLGGDGLARGYWARPAATAAAFVPHPHATTPGERLYRTGDLVRWNRRGEIEFLGRVDRQVKIRGFRIEPGEVEAALVAHPRVDQAVVVVEDQGSGDRRLVAYAAAGGGAGAPAGAELRDFLRRRLPEYMLPAALVVLPRLPLNASGKVDRAALPAPTLERWEFGGEYQEPREGAERLLAEVWREVLRLDEVGAGDNYFALGGDSILAIQIVARSAARGLRITPKQIFTHQTVAELAAVAEAAPALAAAVGGEAGSDVPLTPIQRWFFALDLPAPHRFNQAVLLSVSPELSPDRLRRAVALLVEGHEALRFRYGRTPSGWRQWAAADGTAPFHRLDLSALPAASRERAWQKAAEAAQGSLDLERGPVLRILLVDDGAERRRLLIAAHHLVVDGVSWRILLRDLELACSAEAAPSLPPATPFSAWARSLAAYATSEELQGELDHWLADERRAPPLLPVDRPGGCNRRADARAVTGELDAETTRALLQEVPAAFRSEIEDALLAALAAAAAEWTGDGCLLVEVEGHGREEEIVPGLDLSRTVGWFTTLVPVLLSAPDGVRGAGLLAAVREQRRSVPRGGLGHGVLLHLGDGAAAARLAARPRPEISFNYLGQLDNTLDGSRWFGPAEGSVGKVYDRRGERPHLLDVVASVQGGRLRVRWIYSRELHRRETVERLSASYLRELERLVDEARQPDAAAPAPADFPQARVSSADLDKLLARVAGRGEGRPGR